MAIEHYTDGGDRTKQSELRELKWKELMSRVDAYRFYIKLILEVNAFFYATTGAVILFSLKDSSLFGLLGTNTSMRSMSYPELFLLLPILMGTVVGGFMIYAAALQEDNQAIIQCIRKDLNRDEMVNVYEIPDLKLLCQLLRVFGTIFFLVAAVLILVPNLTGRRPWIFTGIGSVIVIVGWILSWCCGRKYRKQPAVAQRLAGVYREPTNDARQNLAG